MLPFNFILQDLTAYHKSEDTLGSSRSRTVTPIMKSGFVLTDKQILQNFVHAGAFVRQEITNFSKRVLKLDQ